MATLYYNGNPSQSMKVPDSDVSYWSGKGWKTSASGSGNTASSSSSGSGVSLSSLLADPQIASDAKMKAWINGNATLIPKLASLGYTADDLKNEAYAWTRYNHSAFSGDMTITTRSQNSAFGQGSSNLSGDTSSSDHTPGTKGTVTNGSLVKFPDSSTVYLVDPSSKILVPFTSQAQFEEYFGENIDDAWNSIATIEHEDPRIADYEVSTETFGSDWSLPEVDTTSKTIANRYGQALSEDNNIKAFSVLDSFLGLLKADPTNTGIDVMTIDNILNDKKQLAKYVSALAYGGYTLDDIFKDVKIQQMKTNGDTSLGDAEAISYEKNKSSYSGTDAYKTLSSNSNLQMPATIKGITDTGLLDLNIFQMPEELYKELVPIFDPTSEEGKALVDSIKTQWYDQMELQINAETAQDKAQADTAYKDWVQNIEQTYGIQLSSDIDKARNQLDQMSASQGNSGLSGTGMGLEQQVKYLKQMQRSIQANRLSHLTAKEQQEAKFYQTTASPEEIAALVAKDQASGKPRDEWRSVKLGLVPDTETVNSLSLEALKTKYPDADEQSLKNMRSSIVDDNGNFYSTLYKTKAKSLYGDATTGSMGLYSDKRLYQEGKAESKASEEEKQAYLDAGVDNAISGDTIDFSTKTGTKTFGSSAIEKAKEAAENMGSLTKDDMKTVSQNSYNTDTPSTDSTTSTDTGMVKVKDPKTGLTLSMTKSAAESYKASGWKVVS